MTQTAEDNHLLVEDVVSALTGSLNGDDTPGDLRTQMERAAEEFDKRTAHAFGKALLDSLTEDPGNLRQLEALLILGLAHPDVLRKNRISLAVEGRRLAILLERAGDVERARSVLELLANRLPEERTIDHELAGILRRSGNTEELVDRYLNRAEGCVEDGKISEAIPWLQEILLLDRTRRDVARMIRDLRYQEAERQVRSRRRNRVLLLVVAITSVLTILGVREVKIRQEYASLVESSAADPGTLYARADGLNSLVERHKLWAGLFGVMRESDDLEAQIDEHERQEALDQEAQRVEQNELAQKADDARKRGLLSFERGDYLEALDSFRFALRCVKDQPDWEYRQRVEADIAAVEQMLGGDQ